MINDSLYRNSVTHIYLRCLTSKKVGMIMWKLHDGDDKGHSGTRLSASKTIREEYFLPYMSMMQRCSSEIMTTSIHLPTSFTNPLMSCFQYLALGHFVNVS